MYIRKYSKTCAHKWLRLFFRSAHSVTYSTIIGRAFILSHISIPYFSLCLFLFWFIFLLNLLFLLHNQRMGWCWWNRVCIVSPLLVFSPRIEFDFKIYSINNALIAFSANKFMATHFYLTDISSILSIVLVCRFVPVEMENTTFIIFPHWICLQQIKFNTREAFCTQKMESHGRAQTPKDVVNKILSGKKMGEYKKREAWCFFEKIKYSMEKHVLRATSFELTQQKEGNGCALKHMHRRQRLYSFFIRSLAVHCRRHRRHRIND